MNLAFLQYFLAVAETGHFTRAAERLNVTQPTLSAGIARLEETLGSRLFDRRRGVALTDAGNRLLPQARTIVDAWAGARAELRRRQDVRPALRLGVLPTLPDRVVLALAARLSAAGPAIDLVEAPDDKLRIRLQRGQLDAALMILPAGARALHREAYVMAVPPGHALAGRSHAAIADLAATPVVLRMHCEALAEARRRFAAGGARPPVVARTASDARARALVLSGAGICLLPESLAESPIAVVEVTDLRLTRRLGLALRPELDGDIAEQLRDAARALPWTPQRQATVVAH